MIVSYLFLCRNLCAINWTDKLDSDISFGSKKIAFILTEGTKSHGEFVFEILNELKDKGHSISFISKKENLKWISNYNFKFNELTAGPSLSTFMKNSSVDMGNTDIMMMEIFNNLVFPHYNALFHEIRSIIIIDKPDLVICDFFSMSCLDACKSLNQTFIITYQTLDLDDIELNAPYMTHYKDFGELTTKNLSMIKRIQDLLADMTMMYRFMQVIKGIYDLRISVGIEPSYKFFEDFNTNLCLFNTFFGLEIARKLKPNINLIGPIIPEHGDAIDENLSKFLQNHSNCIYISSGTAFIRSPRENSRLLESFLGLIKEDIFDCVIWSMKNTKFQLSKSISEELTNQIIYNTHPNFYVSDWIPQISILQSDKTKLFISHGGLNSVMEGIRYGKRQVVIPFGADQVRNARKLVDSKVGVYLSRDSDSDTIKTKILQFINDDNVDINVMRMQVLSRQGIHGKIKAVLLIEDYLRLKHMNITGNSHFVTPDTYMSYLKGNNYDLYLTLLSLSLIVIFSLAIAFYKIATKVAQLHNKSKVD